MYNCCNKGEICGGIITGGSGAGVGGITQGGYDTPSQFNCCSAGNISFGAGTTQKGYSGVFGRPDVVLTNCYYLEGVQGNTGIRIGTGAIPFLKTESAQVVEALNNYIDEYLEDETINISSWLRWRVGSDGLPELIFD